MNTGPRPGKIFEDVATQSLIEECLPPVNSKFLKEEVAINTGVFEDLNDVLGKSEGLTLQSSSGKNEQTDFEHVNSKDHSKGLELTTHSKHFRISGLKAEDPAKILSTVEEIRDSLKASVETREIVKVTVLDFDSAVLLKPHLIEMKSFKHLEVRARGSGIAGFNS